MVLSLTVSSSTFSTCQCGIYAELMAFRHCNISPFTFDQFRVDATTSPFPDKFCGGNWVINSTICLASALAHLHSAGLVHRDLKIDNILVKDWRVCIGDFGLSYRSDNPTQHR